MEAVEKHHELKTLILKTEEYPEKFYESLGDFKCLKLFSSLVELNLIIKNQFESEEKLIEILSHVGDIASLEKLSIAIYNNK